MVHWLQEMKQESLEVKPQLMNRPVAAVAVCGTMISTDSTTTMWFFRPIFTLFVSIKKGKMTHFTKIKLLFLGFPQIA